MIKPREAIAAEDRLRDAAPDLLEVAKLAVESQGWDGNDPDEERWVDFYAKARASVKKAEGESRD